MTQFKANVAGDFEEETFARRILSAINSVRANPHSIVLPLQQQMHHIDKDNILNVPGRDPI